MNIIGNKKSKINLKTIKAKIMRVLIMAAALPIIILGFSSVYQFNETVNDDFENSVTSLTVSVEESVNNIIDSVKSGLDYIGKAEKLNGSPESEINLNNEFKMFLESNDDIAAAFYFTPHNNRTIIYPEAEIPADLDLTTREWYIKAIEKKGDIAVTSIYIDATSGKNMITLSKAVYDGNELKGVLGADFNLDHLANDISKIKFGENGAISIVDQNGVTIAHSDREYIGKDSIGKSDKWDTISKEDNNLVITELSGTRYKLGFVTEDITGWKVILEVPVDDMRGSIITYIYILFATIVLVLIAVGIISSMFSRKMGNAIRRIKEGIIKSANGDFTDEINISTGDELEELAESFNEMQRKISSLIGQVNSSVTEVDNTSINLSAMSEEVAASIREIAQTVEEISRGSVESANNLDYLSSQLEDVSNEINTIDNATKDVNKMAKNTNNLSKDGIEMIKDVMTKSRDTKKVSEDVNKVVSTVYESVESIAVMNETIAEITEQTNLLALNAAIEAARAGESGRGFAVVADEIRRLAEETSGSAKEIDIVIKDIRTKVKEAVEKARETSETVNNQELSVEAARNIFNDIIKSIEELTGRLGEVTGGINQVAVKKDNVVTQVQGLAAIVEEAAAGTEEVSASCEELSAATDEFAGYSNNLKSLTNILNTEVGKFKLK